MTSTASHEFKQAFDATRSNPTRRLGMGAPAGASRDARKSMFAAQVRNAMKCPTYNMETIESVSVNYPGALTAADAQSNFGASYSPLNCNIDSPPPGASEVFSTMAEPNKFQTYTLVCAMQWRYDLEPIEFTAKGNSWTAPSTTVPVAQPISPDAFSALPNDGANNGALGLVTGASMREAVLEWGWWAGMAFYFMTRGYNLQWQYGNLMNLINETLRYTAYLPSSAQQDSASSSEVDIDFYARRLNDYYRTIGSTDIFLPTNATRIGSESLGGTPGLSVFKNSRAFETVPATFGGVGLRQLVRGNVEFRRLPIPVIIAPGVPLGFKAQQASSNDATLLRRYIQADYGFGNVVPATFTSDAGIAAGPTAAGTAGTTSVEPSLDTPSIPNTIQTFAERKIFKGGPFSISVAFKGFELSPDQVDMLKDSSTRDQLQADLGVNFGRFGW